jgi:hypothetical protein
MVAHAAALVIYGGIEPHDVQTLNRIILQTRARDTPAALCTSAH